MRGGGQNSCFKELTYFQRQKLPLRVRMLEGGRGVKSYLAEFHLNSTYLSKGLPKDGQK